MMLRRNKDANGSADLQTSGRDRGRFVLERRANPCRNPPWSVPPSVIEEHAASRNQWTLPGLRDGASPTVAPATEPVAASAQPAPAERAGRLRRPLRARHRRASRAQPSTAPQPAYPSGQPATPGGPLLGTLLLAQELVSRRATGPGAGRTTQVGAAPRRAAHAHRGARRAPAHVRPGGAVRHRGRRPEPAGSRPPAGRPAERGHRPPVHGRAAAGGRRRGRRRRSATPGRGWKPSSDRPSAAPSSSTLVPASTARQALDRAYRALADVDRMVKAFTAADSPRLARSPGAGRGHRGRLPGRQGGHHAGHRGAAGPGLGHPPRADRRRRCGSGSASTAPSTTCSPCRSPWRAPWSAGSRSSPT